MLDDLNYHLVYHNHHLVCHNHHLVCVNSMLIRVHHSFNAPFHHHGYYISMFVSVIHCFGSGNRSLDGGLCVYGFMGHCLVIGHQALVCNIHHLVLQYLLVIPIEQEEVLDFSTNVGNAASPASSVVATLIFHQSKQTFFLTFKFFQNGSSSIKIV